MPEVDSSHLAENSKNMNVNENTYANDTRIVIVTITALMNIIMIVILVIILVKNIVITVIILYKLEYFR